MAARRAAQVKIGQFIVIGAIKKLFTSLVDTSIFQLIGFCLATALSKLVNYSPVVIII